MSIRERNNMIVFGVVGLLRVVTIFIDSVSAIIGAFTFGKVMMLNSTMFFLGILESLLSQSSRAYLVSIHNLNENSDPKNAVTISASCHEEAIIILARDADLTVPKRWVVWSEDGLDLAHGTIRLKSTIQISEDK